MQTVFLLFCIANLALGAQVTVVNRCPFEIQMQGVNLGNGQSRTTELGTVGYILFFNIKVLVYNVFQGHKKRWQRSRPC